MCSLLCSVPQAHLSDRRMHCWRKAGRAPARLQWRTSLLRTAHTHQGPGTGDHTHHSQGSNLGRHTRSNHKVSAHVSYQLHHIQALTACRCEIESHMFYTNCCSCHQEVEAPAYAMMLWALLGYADAAHEQKQQYVQGSVSYRKCWTLVISSCAHQDRAGRGLCLQLSRSQAGRQCMADHH
jgi:hypothetical protein